MASTNGTIQPMAAPELSRDVQLTGLQRVILLRTIDNFRPPNIGMHRRLDEVHENLCGLWNWEEVDTRGIGADEGRLALPFVLNRRNLEDLVLVISSSMTTGTV